MCKCKQMHFHTYTYPISPNNHLLSLRDLIDQNLDYIINKIKYKEVKIQRQTSKQID